MQDLKILIKTYFFVLAGTILSATVFMTIFYPREFFELILLWEIIAMTALTTLGTLLFFSKKEISKAQMRVRKTIHYIYINIVNVGTAFLCGWIHVDKILQILILLFMIAIVYFTVSAVMFRKEEKTARDMNEQLRKKYPEEEKE